MVFSFIMGINLLLGLLPYVNNFSNIGGFISGLLRGFVLLFNPQLGKVAQNKVGLFDYEVKCSIKLRQKLDRPVMRSVSLVLFSFLWVFMTKFLSLSPPSFLFLFSPIFMGLLYGLILFVLQICWSYSSTSSWHQCEQVL